MRENHDTSADGHNSFIESCEEFSCMRGTPEYLNLKS